MRASDTIDRFNHTLWAAFTRILWFDALLYRPQPMQWKWNALRSVAEKHIEKRKKKTKMAAL